MLRRSVAEVDFDSLTGAEALRLAENLGRAERLCVAAKLRAAGRVKLTGSFEMGGHRDAAAWLASVSGDSVGKARGALALGDALVAAPDVQEAFSAGELSVAQAKVVTGALALDPAAGPSLLETAREKNFAELSRAAHLVERAVLGEAGELARERRAHRGRFCRWWLPESGGVRLEALLSRAAGARVIAALRGEAESSTGKDYSYDQARADALVHLVTRTGSGRSEPVARAILRVDAESLRRGYVEGEEVCEIAGVGSVPARVAKALLGDSILEVVIKQGVDVVCVTTASRMIRHAVRTALMERDGARCVVPGCDQVRWLQIDHWKYDYRPGGPTVLWNLCLLCSAHHGMKTHGDYKLLGGPGKWRWEPTRQLFDRHRHRDARIMAERQARARGARTQAGPAREAESVEPRSRTG